MLAPIILEALMPFDSSSDRNWFEALYIVGPMMFIIGPMVPYLGFAALWAQWSEMKRLRSARSSDGNAADNALSVRGLAVQAVVFLLVAVSFVWRMRIPDEELDEHFLVNLRMWYGTVGWATINTLIFAVPQGVLAWIAWRHKGDGGEIGERSALLG